MLIYTKPVCLPSVLMQKDKKSKATCKMLSFVCNELFVKNYCKGILSTKAFEHNSNSKFVGIFFFYLFCAV